MLFRSRKHSIAILTLVGCLLLPALPAEAGDFGSRLFLTSQDWQEVWEQFLSWFGGGEGRETSENPDDQQWSNATAGDDAGPAIDPNGKPISGAG